LRRYHRPEPGRARPVELRLVLRRPARGPPGLRRGPARGRLLRRRRRRHPVDADLLRRPRARLGPAPGWLICRPPDRPGPLVTARRPAAARTRAPPGRTTA